MRPVRKAFHKLSCAEQSREGVAAYLCSHLIHESYKDKQFTQLNSTSPTVKEAVIYITVVYLCVSWEGGHIAETVGHEYDEDTARSVQRQPNKHAGYCPEATTLFYSPLSAF